MKKHVIILFLILFSSSLQAKEWIITEYGAVGDGVTLNTDILQQVIDRCSNEGGGVVRVPAGTYITGTIFLRSHVMLHLENNAIIRGSGNKDDYPGLGTKRPYVMLPGHGIIGLIQAENISNAGICGTGTIDGRGEDPIFHIYSEGKRPQLIHFYDCQRVSITDINAINTFGWCMYFNRCQDVTIRGVKIRNNWYFNADGIDIDSRNVTISDCIIDCQDDAICLKSYHKDFPCENVTVTNCILSTSCNAIKFGAACFGGFINININNISIKKPNHNDYLDYRKYTIYGATDAALNHTGIALEMVDGGVFDRVTLSNITMTNTLTPIFLRFATRSIDHRTTIMRNIILDNIVATGNSLMSCSVTGVPGYKMENVVLSNIILNYPGGGLEEHLKREIPEAADLYPESRIFGQDLPAYGFFLRHVDNITLHNIQFNLATRDERHALYMEDCRNVRVDVIRSYDHRAQAAYIKVVDSENITVTGFESSLPIPLFFELSGKESSRVKLFGNDFSNVSTVSQTINGAKEEQIHEIYNFHSKN